MELRDVQEMLRLYRVAFSRHGDSSNSVLWPKGRQDLRFDALTRHIRRAGGFSLLDFGCGLAHLKPFLDGRFSSVRYAGADAVPEFVEACREKYPASTFFETIDAASISGEYDYVVSSGAFNILYVADPRRHRELVFDLLVQLFAKTCIHLSANFMTDAVDFRQPDAYHQNVTEMYEFARENLSPRLVIDQQDLPYEFTLTVWKDRQIRRPENTYATGD